MLKISSTNIKYICSLCLYLVDCTMEFLEIHKAVFFRVWFMFDFEYYQVHVTCLRKWEIALPIKSWI